MRTRLELHVRSLSASEGRPEQEAVVERLVTLAERGVIAEYSINVWGRELCRSGAMAGTEPGKTALERVDGFHAWAREADVSLAPFFERKTVRRPLTGEESRTVMRPPVMTLAEYRGGELTFVTPCRDGDTVHSVTTRLEELAVGENEAPGSGKRERPPAVNEK